MQNWFIAEAGGSLGLKLVSRVLSAGDNVFATAGRPDALEAMRLQQHGARLHVEALDMDDEHALRGVLQRAVMVLGFIDVVVCNLPGAEQHCADEDSKAQHSVAERSFIGTVHMARAAFRLLRIQRSGHFIQISQPSQIRLPDYGLLPDCVPYAESLQVFSAVLAKAMAPYGVMVSVTEAAAERASQEKTVDAIVAASQKKRL